MSLWTCPLCGLGPLPIEPHELPVHHRCRPVAELLCVHRGAVIDSRVCERCGERGKVVDVYQCEAKQGPCVLRWWTNSEQARAGMLCCLLCRDRQEPDGTRPWDAADPPAAT